MRLADRGALRHLEVVAWLNGATVGVKQFKGLVMARTGMNKDEADRIANKVDLYVVTKGGRATGACGRGGRRWWIDQLWPLLSYRARCSARDVDRVRAGLQGAC